MQPGSILYVFVLKFPFTWNTRNMLIKYRILICSVFQYRRNLSLKVMCSRYYGANIVKKEKGDGEMGRWGEGEK